MIRYLRPCKKTLTRELKVQLYLKFFKTIIKYGLSMYVSTLESQLRSILIFRKKILRILYNLPSHASCTRLFTESGNQTVCAM